MVKRAGGSGRDSTMPVLIDSDGQEYTQNRDKAEIIGSYFAEKCSLETDFSDVATTFPDVKQRSLHRITTVHFRQSTVRRVLKAINPSKATGLDSVPSRVLKMCADSLARPLAHLFSLCFRQGHQPSAWKVAKRCPGPQEGLKILCEELPSNIPSLHYLQMYGNHNQPEHHKLSRQQLYSLCSPIWLPLWTWRNRPPHSSST